MGIDAEMFVRTRAKVTEDDLRRAGHALYSRFGRAVDTWSESLLAIVPKWEQDGPDIEPEEGETFVRVNLWSRYYGVGYERGDFRLIHDVAEALEFLFPDSQVWYGGDSSGVCAEPFGPKQRAALRRHWLEVASEPYFRSRNQFLKDDDESDGPACRRCQIPTRRYGWGNSYAAYSCECGERVEVRSGVTTVTTRKERQKRFYELRNRAIEIMQRLDAASGNELSGMLMEFGAS